MEYEEKEIALRLQKMQENNLSKEIIIPLLESLGYFKVEFYGGTDEKGKDILCWEYNKFDELKLTVAQVKHFKFKNTASDGKSFQGLYNQLIQCFSESLPFSDQTSHQPEEALLITSFIIDTKTLKTRLSEKLKLWAERITIIDGLKLATLLKKHKPDLINKLMGVELDIYSKLESSLNNEILLKSLGYLEKRNLKHIYIDIDFSLGKRTTQLFFKSNFTPRDYQVRFDKDKWENFKINCKAIENEFSLEFLANSFEESEKNYIIEIKKWEESKKRAKEKNNLEDKNDFEEKNDSSFEKERKKKSKEKKIESETVKKQNEEQEPKYLITLFGKKLENQITEKRTWIEKKSNNYNKYGAELEELKIFIFNCKKIIDCASIILSKENGFLNCLIDTNFNNLRIDFESTRIKLPIEQVFDTSFNFSILGEAGAGKTTCLQMYTLNKQKDLNRLFIYLPLSRIIKEEKNIEAESTNLRLEIQIVKYLLNSGVSINVKEFISILKTKKVTLLLDGLDEAIKSAPWLIGEIKLISEKYFENIQIIITSRASGSYIDAIPFFNITILPFTDEQKNLFIDNWFGSSDNNIAINLKNHFKKNKALAELVNNPLLTTILCVLAENNRPLPNTEIKLYNDRIDLLTGYYDNVKNISRINTQPSILKTLSQKIAFYLHSNLKREEDIFELEKISIKLMVNISSSEKTLIALKELIDPCNIIVPMTDDGKFGFGHLRFQEHLAANEIFINRGIQIVPLLTNSWWKSVILFFSNMNEDLSWFIQYLGKNNEIIESRKNILHDMIAIRPINEREKLYKLLENYISLIGWNELDI